MSKIDDLRKQMALLAEQLALEEANVLQTAFSKIDKIVADANISPEQLIEYFGLTKAKKASASGTKVGRASPKVTHVDPSNSSNTWSSRGRPAKWLQAYIDAGRSKDEFLVK